MCLNFSVKILFRVDYLIRAIDPFGYYVTTPNFEPSSYKTWSHKHIFTSLVKITLKKGCFPSLHVLLVRVKLDIYSPEGGSKLKIIMLWRSYRKDQSRRLLFSASEPTKHLTIFFDIIYVTFKYKTVTFSYNRILTK